MAGFSAEWLALREPADHRARSEDVRDFVVTRLRIDRRYRILDLGAGTGSNLRALSAAIPAAQHWTLVDHDPALLGRVSPGANEVLLLERDVRMLDPAWFEGIDLVTGAALLDLVSAEWIDTLVERCRAVGAAVFFTLSYDGRIGCEPREPEDEMVAALVNRHQRTDKGFGPAVGPTATDVVARSLAAAGYDLRRAPSDWALGPAHGELQRQLVNGWAAAATEVDVMRADVIGAWRLRREAHITRGVSRLCVGHEDLGGVLVPLDHIREGPRGS